MKATVHRSSLEYLLHELRRITALLSARVQHMRADESNPADDEFRGLYVSEEEVAQLLSDPNLFLAGNYDIEYEFDQKAPPKQDPSLSRLSHLRQAFGLSQFELDVILIALAPELELRYEKLYAYLQDDVTRRRPSVDLALRLLSPGLAAQVATRRCFDPEAPLLRYRLIELTEENQAKQVSLLSRTIKLDEGVVAYLLGEERLDHRLRGIAEFATAETSFVNLLPEDTENANRLTELGRLDGYVCVLIGPDDAIKRRLAFQVSQNLERPMVLVDTSLLPGNAKADQLMRLLRREALLWNAPVYWSAYESLIKEENPPVEVRKMVHRQLAEPDGINFVATTTPIPPLLPGQPRREFKISLEMPSYTERQQLWEAQLGTESAGLDLEGLSSRFRLSSGQIVAAAATARHMASWRGNGALTLEDLEAACRSHSNQKLSSLARKLSPRYRWNDLVLPVDQTAMLHEVCEQVKHRSMVYEHWGFDRKLSYGKGLNIVFAGQSGTGKTMSAEIIGNELRMDVYKIDLSNVVSKYIGETEKNLERIFTEAGESNGILFFDEADSLFGKRSEVKDAHDRYANIETGYLLQKMEEYEGIVILATNLRKNLDDAFVRRMHFMLEFPFPEEEDRLEIWKRVFPSDTPIGKNVDLRFMARQFKVAGGNIKNIALSSAFLAASGGGVLEMEHLIKATRREFQKIGKLCTQSDFGPYFNLVSGQ